jgi:hypothetical protein
MLQQPQLIDDQDVNWHEIKKFCQMEEKSIGLKNISIWQNAQNCAFNIHESNKLES